MGINITQFSELTKARKIELCRLSSHLLKVLVSKEARRQLTFGIKMHQPRVLKIVSRYAITECILLHGNIQKETTQRQEKVFNYNAAEGAFRPARRKDSKAKLIYMIS